MHARMGIYITMRAMRMRVHAHEYVNAHFVNMRIFVNNFADLSAKSLLRYGSMHDRCVFCVKLYNTIQIEQRSRRNADGIA